MDVGRIVKLPLGSAVDFLLMLSRERETWDEIPMSLEKYLDEKNLGKLKALNNSKIMEVVETFLDLCKPDRATVITDAPEDLDYVRELSLKTGEERHLQMEGHTIHFDGYHDQARDKANTKVLLPKGAVISKHINTIDRDEGLKEIFSLMDGIMKGKEALILFFSLGPKDSIFSVPALQITDSAYVAHSEIMLYRPAYDMFKRMQDSLQNFFYFVHSAGELENGVSKNVDKRRIYIDLQENRVFSINNQYAGNSLGLKKLALRLAINKAVREGNWLAEHMFISGIRSLDGKRKTYFLGAYPSMCGKTSTAMIPGNTIVGDDIAYIRINEKGEARAANIESGMFGIIKDVNPIDDPLIYKALTTPRELIFSNVLIKDGVPYWTGMGKEIPTEGVNFSGEWYQGKKDENGKEIPPSHPNARFTLKLEDLDNCDSALHNSEGVFFKGIVYGGRDSDTSVPIFEAFNWSHGVFVGASIESETTAATLGKIGVRALQPMANLDFVVVPLGRYFKAHFDFAKKLKNPQQVRIFSTNYFLKDASGNFYDEKVDKKVWFVWAEGRVNGEFDAIETPIGYIPRYDDLKRLFKEVFNKDYDRERYEKEFAIRVQKWLEKLDRIEAAYQDEPYLPDEFLEELRGLRQRLLDAREKFNLEEIPPSKFGK